jgi:two-component system OmpR family sensor kinase
VRTRLPIKAKVAIVTAALTFVILSLFATVIGALAEQRITDGFEDELRATAADLQDQVNLERSGPLTFRLTPEDRDLLRAAAVGGAIVRVVDTSGRVAYATSARDLGPPIDGVTDAGDFRVVSEQLVVPDVETEGTFDPIPQGVTRAVGWVQYAETEASVQTTINRVRLFLVRGARRHRARLPRRPPGGTPRDAPHLGADQGRPRGRPHARPRRPASQAARP